MTVCVSSVEEHTELAEVSWTIMTLSWRFMTVHSRLVFYDSTTWRHLRKPAEEAYTFMTLSWQCMTGHSRKNIIKTTPGSHTNVIYCHDSTWQFTRRNILWRRHLKTHRSVIYCHVTVMAGHSGKNTMMTTPKNSKFENFSKIKNSQN